MYSKKHFVIEQNELDIPGRRLELKVDERELEKRRAGWKAPHPKIEKGWLVRYARSVTSANTGAVLK